ncbi:DUF1853 family protein [Cellulophaga sp. F20128]|uniref:DUF1853 family protein n=1 Tax=Cellulophaga sp. F20128 TaxID=2926413 RepID=UPI001FF680B2|nr:DUF1853 family protein [Cellulophaga sp. F20128]MCK0156773.1 DUF1853 family protein [Cellulophaga sp. F20128]
MDLVSKYIQLQFQGYTNTPALWVEDVVCGLSQFEWNRKKTMLFNEALADSLRLGKRVERFVSAELTNDKEITILAENVQIQDNKLTIGEIDCLLKKGPIVFHIEVIFKFYLYDKNVGTTEIGHWIGPNRNDTLLKKLNKLKEKQLPLLYNTHTASVLKGIGIAASEIQQSVIFKAQLFIPYKTKEDIEFSLVNKDCLTGFYIHFSELFQLNSCKFYIPEKINWLLDVQTQVNWMHYPEFYIKMEDSVLHQRSPLCWIKFPNGSSKKMFVVWWDC